MFNRMRGRDAEDYRMLVEIIRSELSPIKTELTNLKTKVEEVRTAQQSMYTQREIDRMLEERDKEIEEVKKQASDTSSALGALWQQTAIKVGVILALALQVLELMRQVR